tara:strand:+ start:3317 stop:5377 length:2061 start_codon:yes stop_codon:yes gene_type:complete
MATKFHSALVNRSIPSMFNGISQQPASLRLASQGEVQENAYPALVEGLSKRPPTQHIAKLNTDTTTNRFVHFINRDSVERYVLIIENGTLKVFNMAGTAMTLVFTASASYLNSSDPRNDFAVVTIADFTFIVNKTVTTAMDAGVVSGSLTSTVQKFADLPTSPSVGDIHEVAGDDSNNFDNFYVKREANSWSETVKPGITHQFTATTMPHQLVRTATDTFTFNTVTWANRVIGDEASNITPSFIGKKINDVFLHKNRFGILAGENCILSSAPAIDFNFWRESATTLVDSDPIDISPGHVKVSTLNHALPFDKTLLLFSEQTQFLLSDETVLSPKTAALEVTTEFEASSKTSPVGAGANVYFAVPRGNHSALMEFFVEDNVISNDATTVTAHVPNFVPANVFQLEASSNENVIFAISTSTPNEIYVYKYFWQGNNKVQAAWGKWVFSTEDTILGIKMIETDLFIVSKRSDGTYLDKLELQVGLTDTGLNFLNLLDRKASLTGVYDAGTDKTTWTIPYVVPTAVSLDVILSNGFTGKAGQKLLSGVARPTTTTVVATGDFSASTCFVGLPYEFKYQFSEQFIKDGDDVPLRESKLMLRNMAVNYTDTAFFKVEVTPEFRDTATNEFTGGTLGTNITVGTINLDSGAYRFPLLADASGVTIVITNDSHLPCVFQSAEWTGMLHQKASRS